MKFKNLAILLVTLLSFSSCEDNGNDAGNNKGLVSFKNNQNPSYSGGQISFIAQVQFGFSGKAVECEYDILDGTTKITSGKASCSSNADGMGLFWESAVINVPINSTTYKGKTITVYLDPSNKVTSKEYTTEVYVNSYKKGSVIIP